MNSHIRINKSVIGPGCPVYIIAELSANHGQSFEKAVMLVKAAAEAGANAVKLQTYTPDTMTIHCSSQHFRIGKGTVWEGRNLYDLYGEAYTPWKWQPKLKAVAEDLGVDLFSTVFDNSSIEFLEKMHVWAYKIASFELVDLPLIKRVAETGKPIILSTGMASLGEIDEAVKTSRETGNSQVALLKCTSAYPASPAEMNLRTIPHLAEAFQVPVGLSDHTLGIAVSVAGVALGACIVEKHFTLSRSDAGPDSAFSLEPAEFRAMVQDIREVEKALGTVCYEITEHEAATKVFRRSLFVVEDMETGDVFTGKKVRCIRPGYGLAPKFIREVLGRRASQDIARGTPLNWELILS